MINKRKKAEGLGEQGLRALSYIQFRGMETLHFGDLSSGLGLKRDQERRLLSRLCAKGQIIRLKKGVYLVSSHLPPGGRLSFNEYYILAKFMEVEGANYQVSGQVAFHLYGFDEQVPNVIFVYNDRVSGKKKIGGFAFDFVKTSVNRLKAFSFLKESSGTTVPIATKTKALVDAVYDWSRFNTLPKALLWIVGAMQKEPRLKKVLINDMLECGNIAVVRRIGCLLAHNGFSKQGLRRLKQRLGNSKSLIPLIPKKPARGSVDRYWGVIINDTVEF